MILHKMHFKIIWLCGIRYIFRVHIRKIPCKLCEHFSACQGSSVFFLFRCLLKRSPLQLSFPVIDAKPSCYLCVRLCGHHIFKFIGKVFSACFFEIITDNRKRIPDGIRNALLPAVQACGCSLDFCPSHPFHECRASILFLLIINPVWVEHSRQAAVKLLCRYLFIQFFRHAVAEFP